MTKKTRLCCALAVLSLLLLLPDSAANAQGWRYHTTEKFVVAYFAEEKLLAMRVLGELKIMRQQLADQLNFDSKQTITAFLCPSQEIFNRMTGGSVPHWGEAAADARHSRIYLKSPRASATRELVATTIKHELSHLLIAELAKPNRVPRWLDEGTAILLSGETRHVDPTIISRAIATGSLASFEEIEDLLSFASPQAGLAYSESYHAVKFLIQRHGPQAIKQYAQAVSAHADQRQAFRAAFGEDLWDFEVAYFDHLRQNFRWYFLLDDTVLFGTAVLVLVIAGYVATKIRSRKKMAEWDQAEEPSDEEW